MNTPIKSKCDRTPTKATCDRTPTPRTDEAWAAWQYAGSGISVHVGRELERELTAVTQQRDTLAEALNMIYSACQGAEVGQYASFRRVVLLIAKKHAYQNQYHFPDVGNMIGTTTTKP